MNVKIISIVVLVLALSIGVSNATWCDTDFTKRINVSLDNTAGSALTYYQVYVNLTANPINETSMRVYNATDCTLRPHWCENETGGDCYGVWVNYSAVVGSSWTNDTAIYYDNSSVSSVSEGNDTFIFFDNFNRANSATVGNGWSETGNSQIKDNCVYGNDPESQIYRAFPFSSGMFRLVCSAKRMVTTPGISFLMIQDGTNNAYIAMGLYDSAPYNNDIMSAYPETTMLDGYVVDTFYEIENCRINSDNFNHYVNHGQYSNVGYDPTLTTAADGILIYLSYYAGSSSYMDWVFVGKYASVDPTTSLGSEENQPGVPIISNEQPTSPISKSLNAANFEIKASTDISANNRWRIDRTGGYEHLEWDNSTTAPAYTFSPQTEGEGTYIVELTAYNTTLPLKYSSTIWDVTVSNIIITLPSPGVTETKYVSNKTVMYSATPSTIANCSWKYQNGTLIEWDNSTVSPSMELWINSSSITEFNINLTVYDVSDQTNTNSTLWDNTISNDVYDSDWTWERLNYFDGYDFATWTGLAIGDDVDNDGVDEFFAASRANAVHRTLLIQELDGTHRLYDVGNTAYIIDGTSLHDVDGDGKKEVIVVDSGPSNVAYSNIFTFNATHMEDSNTFYSIQTSGSDYGHGISWFTIGGVESYYFAGCGQGEVTRVTHNYVTQSKQEIDDFSNSGDATLAFDLDGDGQDELLAVEGWCTNCARVWAYKINLVDGTYDSKKLLFDNDLDNAQAYSVELFSGDIDNDGIENLILIWSPDSACAQCKIEAYEWNVSNYGEGNYTEAFAIDNSTATPEIGASVYGRRWDIGDIDNDGLNELIWGTQSDAPRPYSHVIKYDIGTNGVPIGRTFVANYSNPVYFGSNNVYTLNPVIVNDSGTLKIVTGVTGVTWATDTGMFTDIIMLTSQEVEGTTPAISNVQNGSISPMSQYINWTVNQTAHNRILYSNESDLTPAYYSSWQNSTNAPNITLSGLDASTQYWYQAWSYNVTNNSLSANSSTMSFTTAADTTSVLHIDNVINLKDDWGREFNSNFSANVTLANASGVWMNFSNAEFTNTSLGWLNLTLDEWVNESHNANAPVTNISVTVFLNGTGATNDSDSFYYEITKRTNTATMDSSATQNADTSETFYVNGTCNEEYSDTFLGGANLLEDDVVVATDSSVTDYVNFSHSESVAGQYNYTIRFYNLTHYDNATTSTYSNVTVYDVMYEPPNPTNLQNVTGNFWANHTWSTGTPGNVTDSFNVSVFPGWYNTTLNNYYNDSGLLPHDWSNVTVWAYNSSGNGSLSTGSVSDNVQIPNNIPVLNGLPDNTTTEDVNQTDIFDLDDYFIDADSDTPTYLVESNNQSAYVSVTINASNNVSYTLASGWNGTAEVVVNVTDGWGGEDSDTFLIIVNAAAGPGDYIPATPTTLANTTGNYYVNFTWSSGGGANITDSYNVSWNTTWYNTTLTAYMQKEVGASNWGNVTVYAYNTSGSGSLSANYITDDVQAPAAAPVDYPPATPTTLANTSGDGWVHYTWSSGGGANITDSYNVSWNLTWYNTTLVAYMNDTVGAFGWANISVWAYNSTNNGSLSAADVSDNTQASGGTYATTMTTTVYNLVTYYGSVNSTAEQFGLDITNVDYIARYNNVNNTFTTHIMGTSGNNFTTVHGRGYFVYLNVSGGTTYNRNNILDVAYYTNLLTGWDVIGWTNATNINAEGLISSLGSACKYTSMLNVDGLSYTTHTSGFSINNHAVAKGKGYWVWVNANTNWGRNS